MNKVAVRISMCVHCLYAVASFFMGYVFMTVQQFNVKPEYRSIIPILLFIVVVVASYARCWCHFTSGRPASFSNTWGLIIPLVFSIGISIVYGSSTSKLVCVLFFLFSFLFILLSRFLTNVSNCPLLAVPPSEVIYYSRRFTIVMPLVFINIHCTLFGCCYVMAVHGMWVSVILYILLFVYLFMWYRKVKNTRSEMTALNRDFLLLSVLVLGIYFAIYYSPGIMPWMTVPNISYSAKTLALSIYCGGVIAIPGLTDLSQIQRSIDSKVTDYIDRDRVLSLLVGASTIAAYITWPWLRYSHIYLTVFALGSTVWVAQVKFRQKYSLWSSIISSFVCLVLTAGYLSSEFLGWWTGATIAGAQRIPFEVIFGVDFVTAVLTAVSALSQKGSGNSPLQRIKNILLGCRVLGIHFCSLFFTAMVLPLTSFMYQNTERVSFAFLMVAFQMLADFIIWVFSVALEKKGSPPQLGQ